MGRAENLIEDRMTSLRLPIAPESTVLVHCFSESQLTILNLFSTKNPAFRQAFAAGFDEDSCLDI